MTDKEARLLEFIIRFKATHDGLSPSYREIMAEFNFERGFRSTSEVHYHLKKLVVAGKITLGGWHRRGIMIPGGTWTYVPE